ncbi:hypothetical protein [Turicibacter sp. TJ11]|uniref:hypothetical protein n=1 Tax=Turicibacter sp. TJ11 TaxID=2806443 RepID=UPI001F29FF48|nr:hypothetical protein [Turicibacter sp. TJ11]
MKKRVKDNIIIGGGLLLLSLILHYIHVLIFKDIHHTMIFLVADIAFIPMEVFFTSMILERMLERREKEHGKEKLNMLVGVFYAEIGTQLLGYFVEQDDRVSICKKLRIKDPSIWDEDYFKRLQQLNSTYHYEVSLEKVDLIQLKELLHDGKNLLITLMTTESLHDHETFTEMLMLIMHLKEELDLRDISSLNESERLHLEQDMTALYRYLTYEWCYYLNYLSKHYPGLFNTAIMLSPFNKKHERCQLEG